MVATHFLCELCLLTHHDEVAARRCEEMHQPIAPVLRRIRECFRGTPHQGVRYEDLIVLETHEGISVLEYERGYVISSDEYEAHKYRSWISWGCGEVVSADTAADLLAELLRSGATDVTGSFLALRHGELHRVTTTCAMTPWTPLVPWVQESDLER